MIKITKTAIFGWEAAIRGMRNPKNSWERSDSHVCMVGYGYDDCPMILNSHEPAHSCDDGKCGYCIGVNDYNLMMTLRNAGTDHGKFLRMIHVQMDVYAPLYWWKEADTYRVGTVEDSCSTMHKIHVKAFSMDDFSYDHLNAESRLQLALQVDYLNHCRDKYLETKDKEDWWQLIQLLPSSYNQKRTFDLNYEVLRNMYKSRKDHKLDEWHVFCDWIKGLPYSELITGEIE